MRSFVFAAALFFAVSAMAQSPITRNTTTTIQVGNPNFSSANATYANVIGFDSVAGTYSVTVNPVAASVGTYFTGFGGSTVTPATAADGSTPVAITLTSPGGAGQGYSFGYTAAVSEIPGASFITHSVSGGVNVLSFSGGGTNLLSDGGLFTSTVVISGDWSGAASHSAATFASGYSVLANFVYDSVLNVTDFAVSTSNYQDVNPGIAFDLYGSVVAVPEPSEWAMMAAGLAVLGMALRRRRAAHANG
jgi:hypothetical protein